MVPQRQEKMLPLALKPGPRSTIEISCESEKSKEPQRLPGSFKGFLINCTGVKDLSALCVTNKLEAPETSAVIQVRARRAQGHHRTFSTSLARFI